MLAANALESSLVALDSRFRGNDGIRGRWMSHMRSRRRKGGGDDCFRQPNGPLEGSSASVLVGHVELVRQSVALVVRIEHALRQSYGLVRDLLIGDDREEVGDQVEARPLLVVA